MGNYSDQNVLFIVNAFPPSRGGVENHVGALVAHLNQLGVLTSVETLFDPSSVEPDKSQFISRTSAKYKVGDGFYLPPFGFRKRLLKKYRDKNISLVSVHTRFFPMTWAGIWVAKKLEVPVILTEHGSGFVKGVPALVRLISWLVDQTAGRWALKKADFVLAISEASKDFIRKLAGVDSQVFNNAINLSKHDPEVLRYSGGKLKLVFAGRLVPGKGWDVFIRSCINVNNVLKNNNLEFHILGDGPCMEDAVRLVNLTNCPEKFIFHGHAHATEVRKVLRCAIYVNPSILSEGFQTTLLEALDEGAVIASYPVPGVSLLKAEGAPVFVSEKDLDSLVVQILNAIEVQLVGRPIFNMKNWGWEQRTQQYLEIASMVVEVYPLSIRGQ